MGQRQLSAGDPRSVRQIVRSLAWIFWGGLLLVIDISIEEGTRFGYPFGERGFRFDFLNDFLGAALIAVACFRLAKLRIDERYYRALLFVRCVAVLSVVVAWDAQFINRRSNDFLALLEIYDLICTAAVLVFVLAMRWLCETLGASESSQSWRRTALLVAGLLLLPPAVFYFSLLLLLVMGRSSPWIVVDSDLLGFLSLVICLVTYGHFFLSLWRSQQGLR